MRIKRFLVGFMVIVLAVGGLGIANVFQKTEVTQAADGDTFAKINFTTNSEYPFEDDTITKEYTTELEAIETMSLPMFKDNDAYSFVGWRLTDVHLASETAVKHQLTRGQNPDTDPYDLVVGEVYEPHELLRTAFYHGDEATFEAVYLNQGAEGTTDIWEQDYGTTIEERTPSISSESPVGGNITVYRYDGTAFTQVSSRGISPANFREALFDIYQDNQPTEDYVIAIAGSNTLNLGTTAFSSIGNKTEVATSGSDVSFYSLNGKANSVTITGSSSDPVTNNTATRAPTGNALLNFSTTSGNGLNFGTNVEFRNIRYRTTFLAANGNSLTLGGDSWGTRATTVYGGAYSGEATAKSGASVTIDSTGTGTWNLYGGTRDGNFNGDTNLVINSYSTSISTVSGGNESSGVINGDTHLSIYGGRNTITNVYGGVDSGWVTGSSYTKMRATDSGNRPTVTNFYGASNSGIVASNVETIVAGQGALATSFYGGANTGNVGTEGYNNYIKTTFDSSLFGNGGFSWSGGNKTRGYIYANIINTVRAGKTTSTGAIHGFNGSASDDSSRLGITQPGIDAFAIDDSAGRKNYAFNAAKNSAGNALVVITVGNIDSHILGGAFSNGGEAGYAHASGMKGYFEGDAFLTIGILNSDDSRAGGYNYCTSVTGFSNVGDDLAYKVGPSTATNSTTNRTYTRNGWDIFGGASRIAGGTYTSYIYGNTGLIQNNVLARWTYGGGYYGTIDGNTSNIVYGGLVDTLEGGGYYTDRIWGDTLAEMHNGEVNFFFSGGGWNDDQIYGNATAYCTGGIINCAIGGTYGAAARHTINGNSNVYVTGGNFSGYPSHGTRGFSGGPTNLGTITGDVSLTLDLRGTTGFQLPRGVNITGGQNTNGTTYVGSSADNTITLNIYTDPGSDVLNGAVIYGDAGNADRTQSGHITMNIDAPDSSIGSLYATSYSNISGNTLRRNVDINVLRAGTIGALSGTGNNTSDSINNTVSYNSTQAGKGVSVNLGTELAENPFTGYATKPSDVSEDQKNIVFGASNNSTGLINFTSLSVENGFTALAGNNGSIKNGRAATANAHYNNYDKFGDIRIEDGSGLGVTSASAFLSFGHMTVNGNGDIYSPAGTGKINLSGITMGTDACLTWHMQPGGANTVASRGTYFGDSNAYQVLTFTATEGDGRTPLNEMASDLTPLNFMGIEDASGKTFVGDSDMTTSASSNASNHREYGIMIPGSVIDFTVSGDYDSEDLNNLLSAGTGLISHDVEAAKTAIDPPMVAYATQLAGVENGTTKGRLVIPILGDNPIYPTLTFDPDDPTGSWLRSGTIDSTKVDGSLDETIAEQMDLDADMELDPTDNVMRWKSIDWTMGGGDTTSDANEYSYTIDIIFSNEMELTGRNIIVTSDQAKEIASDQQVRENQAVFGRPFLESTLSQEDLDTLAAGLDDGSVKKVIPITYNIKDHETNPVNTDSQTWNIVIVPNGSVISTELDFALYAHDAEMGSSEASNLAGQAEVDALTEAKVFYANGAADQAPQLDSSYIDEIKNAGSLADINIIYKATFDGDFEERTLELPVIISVRGYIYLSEVTDVFEFGTNNVSTKTETYWPERLEGTEETSRGQRNIVVTDTRGDNKTWTLTVKEAQPLVDPLTNFNLEGTIFYQENNTTEPKIINSGGAPIVSASNGVFGTPDYQADYSITDQWQNGEKGLQMTVPYSKQVVGEYEGELEWTLSFAP